MGHHVNRKQYFVIFAALTILTALEVGCTELGLGRVAVTIALVGLAVVKAGLVALFYMHLNHDTKILRWSIVLPMLLPPLYAMVLMVEGAWRMLVEF